MAARAERRLVPRCLRGLALRRARRGGRRHRAVRRLHVPADRPDRASGPPPEPRPHRGERRRRRDPGPVDRAGHRRERAEGAAAHLGGAYRLASRCSSRPGAARTTPRRARWPCPVPASSPPAPASRCPLAQGLDRGRTAGAVVPRRRRRHRPHRRCCAVQPHHARSPARSSWPARWATSNGARSRATPSTTSSCGSRTRSRPRRCSRRSCGTPPRCSVRMPPRSPCRRRRPAPSASSRARRRRPSAPTGPPSWPFGLPTPPPPGDEGTAAVAAVDSSASGRTPRAAT